MTRVLLVTDNERVQKVFEDLENCGVLQLRAVANLMQSDQEISGFSPDITFVQSRIAGLSGDIVLRHLRKLLPAEGKTVLLAVDADDAAHGRKQGGRVLEVSDDREELAAEVTAVLEGARDPATKKAAGTGRRRAARKAEAPPSPPPAGELPDEMPAAQEASSAEPAPASPLPSQELMPLAEEPPSQLAAATGEPSPLLPEAAEHAELHPSQIEKTETAAPTPEPEAESKETASFAEMMRAAEQRAKAPYDAVEDNIQLGKSPEPSEAAAEPLAKPAEAQTGEGPEGAASTSPPYGSVIRHRSKRRPLWTLPLILIAIMVPLLYLLPEKKTPATPAAGVPTRAAETAVPGPGSVPKPAPPVSRPVTAGAKPSPAKPAASAPAAKTPAPAAVPAPAPGPAPRPAAQKGLSELPPFLRGVTLDPIYAKGHPGWQRYLGARAEYKLFQEGGVYRAIQVIALTGQTIPDEIFRKVLQEFAGIDSYQVRSTERKQHFLVEHGTGQGNIGITVYRRINDRRVKGLVLYYMQ